MTLTKFFIVTLRHDTGTIRIEATAPSAEEAARIVRQLEGAPSSSVISVVAGDVKTRVLYD